MNKSSRPIYISILLSMLLLGVHVLDGQVNMSARSIGVAGTYMTQSRGVDAIGWNPANLGYWEAHKPLVVDEAELTAIEQPVPVMPEVEISVNVDETALQLDTLVEDLIVAQAAPDVDSVAVEPTEPVVKLQPEPISDEPVIQEPALISAPAVRVRKALRVPFFSAAGQLDNSVISPAWISQYLSSGGYLDKEVKEEMLNTFPETGWSLVPAIRAPFGVAIGNFAFSINLEVNGSVVIPKDMMGMIFNGLRFDEPVSLDDYRSDVQAVVPISFAYGKEMTGNATLDKVFKRFFVGGALKYLYGVSRLRTESFSGSISTHKELVQFSGSSSAMMALFNGSGFALDLGAAADVNDRMSAGLSLHNLLGTIQWTNASTYDATFDLNTKGVDLTDNAQVDSLSDNFLTEEESSGETVKTSYPTYLLAGLQYNLAPKMTIYANYRQYFVEELNFDTSPIFSVAAEARPAAWLPLRLGFSFGGFEEFKWGTGFGLNFAGYHLDVGFSQTRGMFNDAKGVSIAFEQTFFF
ncbi:MAG: DUF5723 family protein [Candidatus Marinimicrobia bacterium]|nr:DUF5723 family protein [Candidatus Neomarinimicrobiota bacterium]